MDGLTGLHLACIGCHKKIVEAVVARTSTDLNILDVEGNSALEMALARGHLSLVNLLLRKGRLSKAIYERSLVAAVSMGRWDAAAHIANRMSRRGIPFRNAQVLNCVREAEKVWDELNDEENVLAEYRRQEKEELLVQFQRVLVDCHREEEGGIDVAVNDVGHQRPSIDFLADLRETFECSQVCSAEMVPPSYKILSCSNDHWICQGCFDRMAKAARGRNSERSR